MTLLMVYVIAAMFYEVYKRVQKKEDIECYNRNLLMANMLTMIIGLFNFSLHFGFFPSQIVLCDGQKVHVGFVHNYCLQSEFVNELVFVEIQVTPKRTYLVWNHLNSNYM